MNVTFNELKKIVCENYVAYDDLQQYNRYAHSRLIFDHDPCLYGVDSNGMSIEFTIDPIKYHMHITIGGLCTFHEDGTIVLNEERVARDPFKQRKAGHIFDTYVGPIGGVKGVKLYTTDGVRIAKARASGNNFIIWDNKLYNADGFAIDKNHKVINSLPFRVRGVLDKDTKSVLTKAVNDKVLGWAAQARLRGTDIISSVEAAAKARELITYVNEAVGSHVKSKPRFEENRIRWLLCGIMDNYSKARLVCYMISACKTHEEVEYLEVRK